VRHVTEGSLRKLIREELATLQQPKETKKTWAAVAASDVVPNKAAMTRTIPTESTKIVPARHLREVVINTSGTSVDMQKRTSKEVVAAVNTASSVKGAVAARQLPSGDTIVTFLGQESKDWHTENPAWAITAFGPTAEIRHRTYTVVAKRLRTENIKGVNPKDMAKEMAEENRMKISRVKVKRVRDQSTRYTTLLVDVNTVEHANQLCERGLIWEVQIYQCEPFSGDLRPFQCYVRRRQDVAGVQLLPMKEEKRIARATREKYLSDARYAEKTILYGTGSAQRQPGAGILQGKRMRTAQRASRSKDRDGSREPDSPKQPGTGSKQSRAGRGRRQLNQRRPKRTPEGLVGRKILPEQDRGMARRFFNSQEARQHPVVRKRRALEP